MKRLLVIIPGVFLVGLSIIVAESMLGIWMTDRKVFGESSEPPVVPDRRLLEGTALAFQSVSRMVSDAVVYIEAKVPASEGKSDFEESGSGVLLRFKGKENAAVVTCQHVVGLAKAEQVEVHLGDGRILQPTKVLTDTQTDLAVLLMESKDLPAAKIGDSDAAHVGQWVLAMGSPFGLSQSVTHGIISAKHRRRLGLSTGTRIKEFIQTDAAINPGNSGGPLVNLDGEVVGINTAMASRTGSSSGVGFSIPINLVRGIVLELLAKGKVERAFLGVEFPHLYDRNLFAKLGLSSPRGALVDNVHAKSPAQKAGIKTGDVILNFDGTPIEDENHLINLVSRAPIGKRTAVVAWRNRQEINLEVILGNWESFAASQSK